MPKEKLELLAIKLPHGEDYSQQITQGWPMTVPVGKVFLESAMPTPLGIVYGCLYTTTEELCSYKKLCMV